MGAEATSRASGRRRELRATSGRSGDARIRCLSSRVVGNGATRVTGGRRESLKRGTRGPPGGRRHDADTGRCGARRSDVVCSHVALETCRTSGRTRSGTPGPAWPTGSGAWTPSASLRGTHGGSHGAHRASGCSWVTESEPPRPGRESRPADPTAGGLTGTLPAPLGEGTAGSPGVTAERGPEPGGEVGRCSARSRARPCGKNRPRQPPHPTRGFRRWTSPRVSQKSVLTSVVCILR